MKSSTIRNNSNNNKNTIQADADFLDYATNEQLHISVDTTTNDKFKTQLNTAITSTSTSTSTSTNTASTTAIDAIHRSNILKIRTDQLLIDNCICGSSKTTKSSSIVNNTTNVLLGSACKWYDTIAEPYCDTIDYILQNHYPMLVDTTNTNTNTNTNTDTKTTTLSTSLEQQKQCTYPFTTFADRIVSITIPTTSTTKGNANSSNKNNKTLRLYTGYRRHPYVSILNQIGYMKNNNSTTKQNTCTTGSTSLSIPTLHRTVVIPSSLFDTKDYLRHRYTDKRNLIVWYVAKLLSHSDLQSTIGSVHYMYWCNDNRKPVLVLIPPVATDADADTDTDTNGNTSEQKQQNKKNKTMKLDTKGIIQLPTHIQNLQKCRTKPRFRIILHFTYDTLSWIPPLRRIPNRCNILVESNNNNKNNNTQDEGEVGTNQQQQQQQQFSCYYNNNCLLEDSSHIWFYETPVGKIPSDIVPKNKDNNDNDDESAMDNDHNDNDNNEILYDIDYNDTWYSNWNNALLLCTIWCQRRNFINGHDTITKEILLLQLLYLFRTKKANPVRMTPIQIFTVWLKLLVDTNWIGTSIGTESSTSSTHQQQKQRDVLVLPLPGKNEIQTISLSTLSKFYKQQVKLSPITTNDPTTLVDLYKSIHPSYTGPIFLDPSMSYNYMGRISTSYIRMLQREAINSINCLNYNTNNNYGSSIVSNGTSTNRLQAATNTIIRDPYSYLFTIDAQFWERHDLYVRVNFNDIQLLRNTLNKKKQKKNKSDIATGTVEKSSNRFIDQFVSDDMGQYESVCRYIIHMLQLALGDRIRTISSLTSGNDNISSNNTGSGTIPLVPISTSTIDVKHSKQTTVTNPIGAKNIVLGITINPDTCFRLVDRGPATEQSNENATNNNNNTVAIQEFLDLWGKQKAELRRFKDGAIVHAVVWDSPPDNNNNNIDNNNSYIQYQNDDKWHGGIVERIIRHILTVHVYNSSSNDDTDTVSKTKPEPQFALRNMCSLIDGVALNQNNLKNKELVMTHSIVSNPLSAHRMILKAFDQLATFLRKNSTPSIVVPGSENGTEIKVSPLKIPLPIDDVQAMSLSLRYADVFPPVPHQLLGAVSQQQVPGSKTVSGAIVSNPIEIQIRFAASSKWPSDLKAIGAAKTAMLIALVNGIESLKKKKTAYNPIDDIEHFDGPNVVTAAYADIGFMGYVFRIFVRADIEMKIIRSLRNPTPDEIMLQQVLKQRIVYASTHHTIVHAVFTSHPSSSATFRLAKRWVASHLLSDHIPDEALELIVSYVYTNRSLQLDAPGTVTSGFIRFLKLLATYDWKNHPLIVDPQGHFSENDYNTIIKQFDISRGTAFDNGPPMYIVSPCNRISKMNGNGTEEDDDDDENEIADSSSWIPIYTQTRPEQVVLNRSVALAQRTYTFLTTAKTTFDSDSWCAAFQESSNAFRSYSVLLRIDPTFLVDKSTSSDCTTLGVIHDTKNQNDKLDSNYTCSMIRRRDGPKVLRRSIYKNVKQDNNHLLLHWNPIPSIVEQIRDKLGKYILVFYNDYCPDVLGIVWRRPLYQPKSFSVINSQYVQPVTVDTWKSDTLVTINVGDILREIIQQTIDIAVAVKVFDYGPTIAPSTNKAPTTSTTTTTTKKRKSIQQQSSQNSDDDSSSPSNDDSSEGESD